MVLCLAPEFFANKPMDLLIRPGITAEMLNDGSLGCDLDALWEAGLTPGLARGAAQALESGQRAASPRLSPWGYPFFPCT